MLKPSGLSSRLADQQKPPTMCERFLSAKSMVYFFHSLVRTTGPMVAESESPCSPVMPPVLNSAIFSPPRPPRAQKVKRFMFERSYPPGLSPQLFGGCCQKIPAQLAPCVPLAVYVTLKAVFPSAGFSASASLILMSP